MAEIRQRKEVVKEYSWYEMGENSGRATRPVLEWLKDIHGSDADCMIEFDALRRQIQEVEEGVHGLTLRLCFSQIRTKP